MTTTFKYTFYTTNQTAPSWLMEGNHDVAKAMLPVVGGISSAMKFDIPNTSTILVAMDVWKNYLDINFNDNLKHGINWGQSKIRIALGS